jgi:hypothetical protein
MLSNRKYKHSSSSGPFDFEPKLWLFLTRNKIILCQLLLKNLVDGFNDMIIIFSP